jgi:SAM-dependent methyltransferase
MDNPETILRYGWGFAPPLIIEAAARNGVFDALESGPKSVAGVASVTGSSTRGLKSIMNALVGLELLTRDSAGKFGLTTGAMPLGEMASQASRLIPPWLNLTEIVRTGKRPPGVNREETFPMDFGAAAEMIQGAKSVLHVTSGETDFGTGHDVAVVWHILSGEGLVRSRKLLEKTHDALAPGGTIVIAEVLVDADRRGPLTGLIFDVNMLVSTEKGNTYSFEEIREWLEICGFTDVRTADAPGPSPLIFADKKV